MDAKGEVLITIMASLAQQESESLSQNVKMGIQYRYQQGKVFVNHNHFLGYTKDAQGNLVIEPEEAKVIKRIFYSYLNGMSMKQIADSLKADGILTGGKTKNWQSSGVSKILKNEKYMGDALLQKTYTVDFLSKKRVKNNGIMPQYYVENDHPAIIPKPVFMQVQQLIKQRQNGITTKNGKHRRLNGKYCFSQIVFCGKCGDIFQRNMWYRPEKVAVWRCASRIKRSKTGRRCMIRNVKEPLLKEATVEAFNQLIEGHELAGKQIKANIMKVIKNSKGPTLDQLDKQLEEVQMQLIQAANQHQNCDALTQQIMDLRKQRAKVQSREAKQRAKLHSIDEIKQLIQAANQHQNCDALTQQIMDLRKQRAKVQSREAKQRAKLHSIDEINKLIEFHKYGLVDFDEDLVRRLVEKITIFKRYMEFKFKDGEVIRINK